MAAKIIAICNQKGGVGKTTTALCLAQELIDRAYKVLFVDTDSQCNSTKFYRAVSDGEATLMDILCHEETTPVAGTIQHTEIGDIIPADPLLFSAETNVPANQRRFKHLKRSLTSIVDEYDYIIIDTPPIIGVVLQNVLGVAEYLVIPVEESGWAMNGLMDLSREVVMARDDNPDLKIAGILTVKAKKNTKKSQRMSETAQQIAGVLGTKCFITKIRESVACTEALTEAYVPLGKYAPNNTTYADYKAFTDELLKEIN